MLHCIVSLLSSVVDVMSVFPKGPSRHANLDEYAADDTAPPILLGHLHRYHVRPGLSYPGSVHIKFDGSGGCPAMEHMSFCAPNHLQRLLHLLRVDPVVTFDGPESNLRLGHAKPDIPCYAHFRGPTDLFGKSGDNRCPFRKGSLVCS